MSLLSTVIERFLITINPIAYWRKKGAVIGQNCEIYSRANLGSEPYLITIGDHVRITDNVRFVTHDGGIWVLRGDKSGFSDTYKKMDKFDPIHICDNVHIGLNATIMPGVTIGENTIIGCGAIVTKDIPPNSVVAGVPAKIIKSLVEYEKGINGLCLDTKDMSYKNKRETLIQHYCTSKYRSRNDC